MSLENQKVFLELLLQHFILPEKIRSVREEKLRNDENDVGVVSVGQTQRSVGERVGQHGRETSDRSEKDRADRQRRERSPEPRSKLRPARVRFGQ